MKMGDEIDTPHGKGHVFGITDKPPWRHIVYTYRVPWGGGPGQFNVGADAMHVPLSPCDRVADA